MIRVLQFADLMNRYDFIDGIVQWADSRRFEMGVCLRSETSNVEPPRFSSHTRQWCLPLPTRRDIPQLVWRLARLLRDWRCDILHAHHYDQAMIGYLATRIHRRTRLVIGRHYSDSIYRSPTAWKRRGLVAIEQLVNRAASRIIVPSSYIAEILTHRQNVNENKIDLVPYGFIAEKYIPPTVNAVEAVRAELGLADRLVIANFARLHEEKGQRFLIEAVAKLRTKIPELLVLIVGEGPERAQLGKQIAAYDLGDVVKLIGWRRDAMTVMAAADIVVQPTLQEAFSQVMAEALWMQKPLVITDVSGATDIIADGENGLLIPKSDVGALAGAVERLACDSLFRDTLARAGKQYVNDHLRIENVVLQYEEAYCKALQV